MKRFSLLGVIALAIFLQADFLLAWHVKHTLKVLVETSPLIITGKVSQVSSMIEKEKGREIIYTYITIETASILKGELDTPMLTIRMLGGQFGEKGSWSEEWIPFKNDEEVLLFLHSKDKSSNIWKIESISGKLSVVNINGVENFDCSMLRDDEVTRYDSDPYLKREIIIDRIKDYMTREGGN